jgi:iron(III) transport system substrate-binding protein
MRARRCGLCLGAALAVGLLLSACSSSKGSDTASGGRCGGAQGTVTWYTSEDTVSATALGKAFQEQCGVSVAIQSTLTLNLWQRFQQEEKAGLHKADVLSLTDTGIAAEAVKEQLVSKLPSSLTGSYPRAYLDPAKYWFANRVLTVSLVYNTHKLSDSSAPKSYADLLEPRFKGKIAILDPTQAATGRLADWQMVNTPGIGMDWFRKLAAQKPGVLAGASQLSAALVSGNYDVGINIDDDGWTQIQSGAPLKIVNPAEGSGVVMNQNMLVKDAQNPTAAVAFLKFLASESGAKASAQATFDYSALPRVPAYPSGRPALASLKLLTWNADKQAAQANGVASQIDAILGINN